MSERNYTELERLAILESQMDGVGGRMETIERRLDRIDTRLWGVLIGVLFSIATPILLHFLVK